MPHSEQISSAGRSRPALKVAIVGTTASGKSSLAHHFARQRLGIELVSVDAMQVYRGMDIGTAKPTPVEQAEVPYHLIDIADPAEEFTLARFQQVLTPVLQDIESRGHAAIAVGGTGLYHRAVVDDLELPGEWPAIRADLEAQASVDLAGLHQRLIVLDPLAATRMEPTNERRIVRALEVCLGSGRPFSSFGPGLDQYPSVAVAQLGLRWDRARLAQRIEARVVAMAAGGWLAEIDRLLDGPPLSRTASQALGYRRLIAHRRGECSLDEALAATMLETRQFAVRQERWFRRDPRIRWVDIEADPVGEALDALTEMFDR